MRRDKMTGTLEQTSSLLHEAGETHHQVFRIVDGVDDDWASWYAQWLIDLPELPDLLGVRPVRSELIYPARRSRQAIHGRGSRRALGELLRAPDPAAFPAIRQLTTGPRTHIALWVGEHPVMRPDVRFRVAGMLRS